MFDKKRWKQIEEALAQSDDAEQVSRLLGKISYVQGTAEYYEACTAAIKYNAPQSLRAITERGKALYFGGSWPSSKKRSLQLVKDALDTSNPVPLLEVLKNANEKTYEDGQLKETDFLSEHTPLEAIQFLLEEDPGLFDDCLKNVGIYNTRKMKFILAFASKCKDPQPALDTSLVKVAEAGDLEKARLLLEKGADPDYAGAQSLLRAGEGGHQETIGLLLPLVRLDLYGTDIVTQLQQKGASGEGVLAIEKAVRNAGPAPAAEETENFALVDADTLAETQTLPDGTVLTTVFNFRTQQEQLVLDKEGAATPVLYVVNFDELGKDVVEAARERLEALKARAPRL
jgi:hypothetical protein